MINLVFLIILVFKVYVHMMYTHKSIYRSIRRKNQLRKKTKKKKMLITNHMVKIINHMVLLLKQLLEDIDARTSKKEWSKKKYVHILNNLVNRIKSSLFWMSCWNQYFDNQLVDKYSGILLSWILVSVKNSKLNWSECIQLLTQIFCSKVIFPFDFQFKLCV